MSQNLNESMSGEQNYQDARERHRELKRELRESRCYRPWHGLVPGLILVMVGVLFLAANLMNLDFGQWWPLIPLIVGVAVLVRAFSWRA